MGNCCNTEIPNHANFVQDEFKGKTVPCRVVHVYDGDTVHVILKYKKTYIKEKLRIAHYDAPEMKFKSKGKDLSKKELLELKEKNKKKANDSKNFLIDLVMDKKCLLKCYGTEKWGRLLGELFIEGKEVSKTMIENRHGVPYEGGKKEEII